MMRWLIASLFVALSLSSCSHWRCVDYTETLCYPPIASPMDYYYDPHFGNPYPCYRCDRWEKVDSDEKEKSIEKKLEQKEQQCESR
jgi:hypothetical protein